MRGIFLSAAVMAALGHEHAWRRLKTRGRCNCSERKRKSRRRQLGKRHGDVDVTPVRWGYYGGYRPYYNYYRPYYGNYYRALLRRLLQHLLSPVRQLLPRLR